MSFVLSIPIINTDPTGHDVGCAGRDASACADYYRQKNPTNKKADPTLADKIKQGDIPALIQLLTPSHFGARVQVEGSFDLLISTSVSIGVNVVYNRNSGKLAGNVDLGFSVGGGFGAGGSATLGGIIGWGSSSTDDVTKGYSGTISGTAAGGTAGSVAVTSPLDNKGLHVDPYSGIVPFTAYVGLGAGGGYADVGGGINGSATNFDLPWPPNWFK